MTRRFSMNGWMRRFKNRSFLDRLIKLSKQKSHKIFVVIYLIEIEKAIKSNTFQEMVNRMEKKQAIVFLMKPSDSKERIEIYHKGKMLRKEEKELYSFWFNFSFSNR